MIDSILTKLEDVSSRYNEIETLLSQPDVTANQEEYIKLSKEYADLTPVVSVFSAFKKAEEDIEEARMLMKDSDIDIKELAETEYENLKTKIEELEIDLKKLLLPKDPDDSKDVFLEIRAGTGGDEAALFSGDLYRMYSRLSERNNWNMEIVSVREGDHGGFKELVARIQGSDVYKQLKFEAGVHRVQRVPTTESQGRVHTSACSVAVLAEQDSLSEVNIDKNDLRVDTFRASGAGGQHVNKTDSAVRLTHLPSGIVVECQDGRSQHKNKEKALSLLAAKLKQQEIDNQQETIASERKILVGTGDRSEKIRTYNFPQGRMTDHRIKLTQHNLDQIMDGDIKTICDALLAENQLAMLSQLESE